MDVGNTPRMRLGKGDGFRQLPRPLVRPMLEAVPLGLVTKWPARMARETNIPASVHSQREYEMRWDI